MFRSARSWTNALARFARKHKSRKKIGKLAYRSLRVEPLEIRQLLAIVSISSVQNAAEGGADGY